LIIHGRGARGRDAEGDVCAGAYRLAQRLRGNRGRAVDGVGRKEINAGCVWPDADGINKARVGEDVIVQGGADGVAARGEADDGISAIAISISHAGGGNRNANALDRAGGGSELPDDAISDWGHNSDNKVFAVLASLLVQTIT